MLKESGASVPPGSLGICEVRPAPPTVRCQAPTTRFHAATTSPLQPRPTSQTGSEGISVQATISDKDQSVEVSLISTLT